MEIKTDTCIKDSAHATDLAVLGDNTKSGDVYELSKPSKLMFEKIEANFTMALQKICDQQAELFDKRIRSMEDYYNKSMENNNKNFSQLLNTVTHLLKPLQETEKVNTKVLSLEKNNNDLKESMQEIRSLHALNEASLKSKLDAQEMQLTMQKQNYDKTLKELQSTIEALEDRLTEKDCKLQETELLKSEMAKALEQKGVLPAQVKCLSG